MLTIIGECARRRATESADRYIDCCDGTEAVADVSSGSLVSLVRSTYEMVASVYDLRRPAFETLRGSTTAIRRGLDADLRSWIGGSTYLALDDTVRSMLKQGLAVQKLTDEVHRGGAVIGVGRAVEYLAIDEIFKPFFMETPQHEFAVTFLHRWQDHEACHLGRDGKCVRWLETFGCGARELGCRFPAPKQRRFGRTCAAAACSPCCTKAMKKPPGVNPAAY